jgi:ABC-type lipopolysaccharide export system ATPase subunit
MISRRRYLLIDELSLGLAPLIVHGLMAAVKDVPASGVGVLLIEQFVSLALVRRPARMYLNMETLLGLGTLTNCAGIHKSRIAATWRMADETMSLQ